MASAFLIGLDPFNPSTGADPASLGSRTRQIADVLRFDIEPVGPGARSAPTV